MGRPSEYPQELRERAMRMVVEVRPDDDPQWAAVCAVSGKLGIGSAETLRIWVRRGPRSTPVVGRESRAMLRADRADEPSVGYGLVPRRRCRRADGWNATVT